MRIGQLRLLALFLTPIPLSAAWPPMDSSTVNDDFIEAAPWQEEAVSIPTPPTEERLIEVAMPSMRHTILIDRESITSTDDGVIRYTIVIRSPGGANNIQYEGIHCLRQEYRRYAYGASDGTLRRLARDDSWHRLTRDGEHRYRSILASHYLCDEFGPQRDREQIIQQIRYPTRPLID